MSNLGTKRQAAVAADDDEVPNKRVSDRYLSSQLASFFRRPGPASSKKAFSERNSRSQPGSFLQRPGPASSKKVPITQETAVNKPGPSFEKSYDPIKNEPEARRTEFIWLVRKFPHLYNPKDPFYRDRTKKEKSWTAVSEVLGTTVNECQASWKVLRDRYCRERKKLPEHIASDFREVMETDLKFLEPIVQHRKMVGNSGLAANTSFDENLELESVLSDVFCSRASMASAQSSTSRQCLVQDCSNEQPSTSNEPQDPSPRIIISTNKDNNLWQLTSLISTATARPSLSPCNRGSRSAAATVLPTPAGTRTEIMSNGGEDLDNRSSHGGSFVEEDHGQEDVASEANGRSEKNPGAPLDAALSALSTVRETLNDSPDIDKLIADTLCAIFRQFQLKEKILLLNKFSRCIVKFQKKV